MERKSLKDIILELEDKVLANAGVSVFEEVFKLIFTKLYDEFKSQKNNPFRRMKFRNTGQTDPELRATLQGLFDGARNQWPGVFPEISTFKLSDKYLSICVSRLQNTKLLNADLREIEDAFEHLLDQRKGGVSFTPRPVVDMCVKMLNPKRGESMIDPAAGTCRFPTHTVFQDDRHPVYPCENSSRISEIYL